MPGIAEQGTRAAVDDDRAVQAGELRRGGEYVPGDQLSPEPGPARAVRPEVGAEHDVRVEDGQQRVEVAVPGGGQEGVNDLPLPVQVRVGHGRLLDAAPGPAGELPGRLGG